MARFAIPAAALAFLAAASPAFRPPPNNPPGWDDIPDSDLVVTPVDPMDSTSLKLVVSTGYNFDDQETTLGGLMVRAEVRTDVPAGSFGERQDWFDNVAIPVSFQVQGSPVAHELMTIIVTGLAPDTTYCFGIQGTDYQGYHSLLDEQNVATGKTSADGIKPDPVQAGDVQVTAITAAGVTLSVITPGDDAPYQGHAASLEVRVSTSAPGPDLAAWYAQIPPANRRSFDAGPAHLPQSVTIGGLAAGTSYYAAVRAYDETAQAGDLVSAFAFETSAPPPPDPETPDGGPCSARSGSPLAAFAAAGAVLLAVALRR